MDRMAYDPLVIYLRDSDSAQPYIFLTYTTVTMVVRLAVNGQLHRPLEGGLYVAYRMELDGKSPSTRVTGLLLSELT